MGGRAGLRERGYARGMVGLWLFAAACVGSPVGEAGGAVLDAPGAASVSLRDTAAAADSADDPAAAPAPSAADLVAPLARAVTVYAVRHAEKESGDDPGLTEAGQARAEALAVRMAGVPLAAVYATDQRRTQETVAPTAAAHGLPVVTAVDAETDLAPLLLATGLGHVVLHAGHTYTLPAFFEGLGLADPPEVEGYGQLWIVTATPGQPATIVEERYGDPEE